MKVSELLLQYKTDKNYGVIDHSSGHYYGDSYDEIFSWFNKNEKLNILEVGAQKGGSLKAWKEYFINSSVTGIDIVDVREKEYMGDGINFILSDVKKINIQTTFKKPFDIIIDDGSHFIDDVLFVVNNYLDKLNINGVLIIEDTQSPITWLRAVLKIVNRNKLSYELLYRDMRKIGHYDDFLIIIKRKETSLANKSFTRIKNNLRTNYFVLKNLSFKYIISQIKIKLVKIIKKA